MVKFLIVLHFLPTKKHVQFAFPVAKVLGFHVAVWRLFNWMLWRCELLVGFSRSDNSRRRGWVREGTESSGIFELLWDCNCSDSPRIRE